MDKIVLIGGDLAIKYTNFRKRDMTINERYEGWMRSDFTTRKVPDFDSVAVVKIK